MINTAQQHLTFIANCSFDFNAKFHQTLSCRFGDKVWVDATSDYAHILVTLWKESKVTSYNVSVCISR